VQLDQLFDPIGLYAEVPKQTGLHQDIEPSRGIERAVGDFLGRKLDVTARAAQTV
jgi:hypothetical protein